MSDADSQSERTGRVRKNDRLQRVEKLKQGGFTVPGTDPIGKAGVVWRCASKGAHRLARVWQTPVGWHLIGDSFRVQPQEWVDRLPPVEITFEDGNRRLFSLDEDWASGSAPVIRMREVAGVNQILDGDFDRWPKGEFEVGCRHGHARHDLGLLAEDCARFLTTRTVVSRTVSTET